MAFFAEDAVIHRHPWALRLDVPLEGAEEIRASPAIIRDTNGGYEISNVQASGNMVTWDYVRDSGGTERVVCTGAGHQAIIEDGKILEWTHSGHEC